MVSGLRRDPYLWIHFAGLAIVPLWGDLCLAGLASASPIFPAWIDFGLMIGLGGLTVLWMQWVRPFYVFSLGPIVLKPESLTVLQQRILVQFRGNLSRGLSLVGLLISIALLGWLYPLATMAATATPFAGIPRLVGLLIATIGFWGCNLFLQVPLSVVGVLLTPLAEVDRISPYPVGKVAESFTLFGFPVDQLLPIVTPLASSSLATDPLTNQQVSRSTDLAANASKKTIDPKTSAQEVLPSDASSTIYEERELDDPWG